MGYYRLSCSQLRDEAGCCSVPPLLHCRCAARRLWDSYFPQVDAVIYLVDSMDRERFPEAKRELDVSGLA